MLQRLRGWLTVWVIPLLAVAGSVAPLVMYWGRYPDPLAVHWGLFGEPSGSLPLWLYAVGMIGGMLLAWWGHQWNQSGTECPPGCGCLLHHWTTRRDQRPGHLFQSGC